MRWRTEKTRKKICYIIIRKEKEEKEEKKGWTGIEAYLRGPRGPKNILTHE